MDLDEAMRVLKAAEPMQNFMYVLRLKQSFEIIMNQKLTLDEFGDILLQAEGVLSQDLQGA